MIIETLISAIISAVCIYYYNVPWKYGLAIIVANIIASNILSYAYRTFTKGSIDDDVLDDVDDVDDVPVQSGGSNVTRPVYYGDSITIYSNNGKFMRMNSKKYVDGSSRHSNPEELPNNSIWEHFIIENANDRRWLSGPRIPVKYGDKIYLRSWQTEWVSPSDTQDILSSTKRTDKEQLIVTSSDITGKTGSPVLYADAVYFQTWKNTWISDVENTTKYTHIDKKDETTIFNIYDNYGSGQKLNWAGRGFATQSSQYGSHNASNAIDNNTHSFNHTQKENNAWLNIELPKDINVNYIKIINRSDCCQERIKNFDVILTDRNGKPTYTRNLTDVQKVYELHNIGRTTRNIKVQLRGKNFLHITGIIIHGTPVNYSTLLETPVSATLINKELELNSEYTRTLHHDSVPYLGRSKAVSITMFVKPKENDSTGSILAMGENFQIQLYKGVPVIKLTDNLKNSQVTSSIPLKSSSWNHLSVVYKPQIKPKDGWLYGEFISKPNGVPGTCCYIVNPEHMIYYRLVEPGPFQKSIKQEWKASYVDKMMYRGDLINNVPTLSIYVNGQLSTSTVLKSALKIGNKSLIIGTVEKTSSVNANVNMLRFYNYPLNLNEIARSSVMQHDMTSLLLTRGIIDTSTQQTIGAHTLPNIKAEVSVSFWLRSERDVKGSGEKDVIFWKGIKDPDSAPGMWFASNSNRIYAPVKTQGTESSVGIKDLNVDIKPNLWYHIAQILKDRVQFIYINGKLAATSQLPSDVEYTPSSIKIGGFKGKIMDFTIHNFALTKDEVLNRMGRHPEYKRHGEINKIWGEQGCIADLFADPESELAISLTNMAISGEMDKVHETLNSIKEAADKGDKDKLVQCYGEHTSTLYDKLKKSTDLLKYTLNKDTKQGKKCLPTAPFTCKDRKVNDFDIRTHQDFHKYTLTDNIIPPEQLNNPDFSKFAKQLEESNKALEEMKRLRDESQQKLAALQNTIPNNDTNIAVKQEQIKLAALNNQHAETAQSVETVATANLEEHPEYKRMALELKTAREAAAANLAQNMDLETLRNNPMFKDTMNKVIERMTQTGSNDSNGELLKLEQDLRKQKQELETIRAETVQQLTNTRQMAKDIFNGISGLSPEIINNIIKSKGDISNNEEYQSMLNKVKQYSTNDNIQQNPEYIKLVKKLNVLTHGDVAEGAGNYKDFVVQGHKCGAMFEEGKSNISTLELMKIFKKRVKSDPDFKALFNNIIESTALSDRNMAAILKKAKDEQYHNTPEFQSFLMKVTKQQLKVNPIYSEMIARIMDSKQTNIMRLEDHPEYNQYARDMQKQYQN